MPLTGARRLSGGFYVSGGGVCAGSSVRHNCYATPTILARNFLDGHAMYTLGLGQIICFIHNIQEKVSFRYFADLNPAHELRLLPTLLGTNKDD